MKKEKLFYFILGGVGLIVFLILGSYVFTNALERTNENTFCIKCHVMEPQYLNLMKGGLHNNLKCVDCHLPNDHKIHFYSSKIISGTKDFIVFHTGLTPEKISVSSKGKETIKKNCIRCHFQIVSKMNTEGRNCWDCHRRVSHQSTGFIETNF